MKAIQETELTSECPDSHHHVVKSDPTMVRIRTLVFTLTVKALLTQAKRLVGNSLASCWRLLTVTVNPTAKAPIMKAWRTVGGFNRLKAVGGGIQWQYELVHGNSVREEARE